MPVATASPMAVPPPSAMSSMPASTAARSSEGGTATEVAPLPGGEDGERPRARIVVMSDGEPCRSVILRD